MTTDNIQANEVVRMRRIEELMALDPELGTPEGEELNRLVDEQVEYETQTIGDWK